MAKSVAENSSKMFTTVNQRISFLVISCKHNLDEIPNGSAKLTHYRISETWSRLLMTGDAVRKSRKNAGRIKHRNWSRRGDILKAEVHGKMILEIKYFEEK